jgi:hypothetical protein
MKWLKKGLIFEPPGNLDWMATHAALPFAERVEDHHRVYISGRDEKGRAEIGYFEIDLANPKEILQVSDRPVIGLGPLGSFDDSGVTSSWIVDHNSKKYQYYTGWSLGVTVPFYFYIGLAVREDGAERFCKISEAPVLGRNRTDPYLTASPCVLIEDGVWRMWYVSCTRWEMEKNRPKHYYHIKYAESKDGLSWKNAGVVCIDFKSKDEYALSRPCVIKEDGFYKMWYSYRGQSYRIGYAESKDGIRWKRKDEEVGIDVSRSGWDSEMIEYPFVFDHKGKRYMLYNGDGYGKTGIGLAVLATGNEIPDAV